MIIDCHTHLNRYFPHQPPTLAERYAQLLGEMDTHGIRHAVVLSSYVVNDERPGADEIANLVDPGRMSVVAGVSVPHLGSDQVAFLRDLLSTGRVKGLKLYPGYQPFELRDRAVHPVYQLAAEHGVPVMIHTGDTFAPAAKVRYTHPLQVDELAVDFREVTFVICHLGNPWMVDAMEVIYKNENVLGDISGLTLGAFEPRYERLVRGRVNDAIAFINDPAKLMFGTDWPISDIGSYLRFANSLELTEAEKEGLMWRNAARLFRIPVVEGTDGRA